MLIFFSNSRIADHLARALGCLPDDLGAKVFLVILELALLGNRDPMLQTRGRPHLLSISTHYDLGPSVRRTASASANAPRRIFSRAADCTSRRL